MHHFFIKESPAEDVICITGADVNHIRTVLRMKEGEQILVSCLHDADYTCQITSVTPEQIVARVLEVDREGRELPARIHLFQGVPKSDKLEWISQKAVELGVSEIIPVQMQHCVAKLDAKKIPAKCKRWEGIAESAAKQSKRSLIPEIHRPMEYEEALDYGRQMDLMLVPYECAEGMAATKEAFSLVKPGMDIGIFIGPEGGFAPQEIDQALARGGKTISLGKRILRTETAGMAMIAALMLQLEIESTVGLE